MLILITCPLQCGAAPVGPGHKSMSGFPTYPSSLYDEMVRPAGDQEQQSCKEHYRPLLDKLQNCHGEFVTPALSSFGKHVAFVRLDWLY